MKTHNSATTHLADVLKQWRANRRLPLKTVAADLGISRNTWSLWENGKRVPSADYIPVLLKYMAIPICRLLAADCATFCPCHAECNGKNKRKKLVNKC